MNKTSRAARVLGRMARGRPKHYTKEELEKRTERILEAGIKRWPMKNKRGIRTR